MVEFLCACVRRAPTDRLQKPLLDASRAATPPSQPTRWLAPPCLARPVNRRQSPLPVRQVPAHAALPPSSNPSVRLHCLPPRAMALRGVTAAAVPLCGKLRTNGFGLEL